jgi:predicted esterase
MPPAPDLVRRWDTLVADSALKKTKGRPSDQEIAARKAHATARKSFLAGLYEEDRLHFQPPMGLAKRWRLWSQGKDWDRVFDDIDTNKNGVIDAAEFFAGVRNALDQEAKSDSNAVTVDAQLRAFFTGFDVDESGDIDRAEFRKAMAKISPQIEREEPPLRVLCLHGAHQSAQKFSKQISNLVRKCRSIAEFVFIDAPHTCEGEFSVPTLCWWHSEDGPMKNAESQDMWSTSSDLLLSVLREATAAGRPFHGLVGFSNGAGAAALLLKAPVPDAYPTLKFALFAGGYLPNPVGGSASGWDVPSLHMVGELDEVSGMNL